jgi:hypothetical protein
MFLGLPDTDPDPIVRDTDPDPDLIRHWNRFQVRISSPHITNTINKAVLRIRIQIRDSYVFGPPIVRDTDPDLIRQWNRFQVRVSSPHIISTINKEKDQFKV